MSDSDADSTGHHSLISLASTSRDLREAYHLNSDDDNDENNNDSSNDDDDDFKSETQIPGRIAPRRLVRISPPENSSKGEQLFLNRMFEKGAKNGSKDWLELYLDNFHIHHIDEPDQPVPLHKVASHNHKRSAQYAFSGRVRHEDGSSLHVKMLGITGVEVGNFGGFEQDRPTTSSCRNAIYLQTINSRSHNCYYLLQAPSKEYAKIFASFQWLATFVKHINDYAEWKTSKHQRVHLEDFRQWFGEKLNEWHSRDPDFQEWVRQCGGITDFRRHFACAHHAEFVYDQIYSVNEGDNHSILSQPIWSEAAPQCLRTSQLEFDKIMASPTFVTNFVFKCFLPVFPLWEERHDSGENQGEPLLVVCDVAPEIVQWRNERSARLSLNQKSSYDQSKNFERHGNGNFSIAALLLQESNQVQENSLEMPSAKLVGKVVVIRSEPEQHRYAYVYARSNDGCGLNVKWLILPNQSICEGRTAGRVRNRPGTFYPIGNELFFSDECCCDTVPTRKVVAAYGVSILQDHSNPGDKFFVHRQYVSKDLAISEITEEEIRHCYRHYSKHTNKSFRSTGTATSSCIHRLTKRRILSLFTGCGLFDSGFEKGAGGTFETVFAADCIPAALASFKLNHPNPHHCEFYHGDVNDPFQEYASGKRRPPNIHCLLAGCPCQGFSRLNTHKNGDTARKNCSMAAHTIAWVDLLRPEMVIIENVPDMDPLGSASGPTAAGQCISAFVAMGYQVKIAINCASNYGSATSRQRLFMIATRPGLPLPEIPLPTHGTGQDLFPVVTASMATLDLPKICNSNTFISPRYPDHVPYRQLSSLELSLVSQIPTTLSGGHNNLSKVEASKLKSPAAREWLRKHTEEQRRQGSSSWCRINPNRPMGTIITSMSVRDSRSGKSLHWFENRLCSHQENRVFQGVPEEYILVGSREQQMKHIGNSVAWASSNVLGRACDEA